MAKMYAVLCNSRENYYATYINPFNVKKYAPVAPVLETKQGPPQYAIFFNTKEDAEEVAEACDMKKVNKKYLCKLVTAECDVNAFKEVDVVGMNKIVKGYVNAERFDDWTWSFV